MTLARTAGTMLLTLSIGVASASDKVLHTPRLSGMVMRLQTRGIVETPFPKPLPSREVWLYAKRPNVDCCRQEDFRGRVVADKKAHFSFTNVSEGDYWIAVIESNVDFVAPVVVDHKGYDCRGGDTIRVSVTEERLEVKSPCVLEQD